MVGFDATNKETISISYLCRWCRLILREPFQLNCDHRHCKSCIDSIEGDIIKCVECQGEASKNDVKPDRGYENEMKLLAIICSLCEWDGLFKDYEKHLEQSHQDPVCGYCGEKFSSKMELDEHEQKYCIKNTVPHAYQEHSRSDGSHEVPLPEHVSNFILPSTTCYPINPLQHVMPTDQYERESVMEFNTERAVPISTESTNGENNNVQLQEIHETVNILAGGITVLNDDVQRLSNESVRMRSSIESLIQDCASIQMSVEEQTAFLNGFKINQDILQQDFESLKQTVDDMQHASYDGTLIWKITNFREKMMDAQSERQTSIYSPPFYSSPTGYKMRAKLYLHGDGNARRTHMSLFFVLMRGPNDAILKFPFDYTVTFCLLNQISQQQHIIGSFRPDITSTSFQRPRSEMNIAGGIPKFFPLAMIQQEGNPYVQDDAMFIKIMVNFGNMSRSLLPFASSLNPGIPMHVQQVMIDQEAERRVKQSQ